MAGIQLPERLFQSPMVDQRGFLSRTWAYLLRETTAGANAGIGATEETALFQRFAQDEPDSPAIARSGDEPDVMPIPQAPRAILPDAGLLAVIPAGLGPADAGREYRATDYRHRYIWTGTAWQLAEGDASGYVVAGKPNGAAPNGGLWGLCDGSAYNVAQDDGTVASVTTQDMTGDAFLVGGAPGRRAAAAPKWDPTAKTEAISAGTPAGTVGVAVDDHASHTHTVAQGAFTTAKFTVNASGTAAVTGGGAVTSPTGGPSAALTHTASGSFTGAALAVHSHNLADANAKILAPSEVNGGLPVRVATNWYIRR